MTFARKSGGANVALTTVKRRYGGAWTNVQTIKRRLSGGWVTVWQAYTAVTASVSPTSASASTASANTTVSTNSVTASATNGNGSYTYAWSYVSGDTTLTIGSPNSATTNFSGQVNNVNTSRSATFRCHVSDGTTSADVNVTVTLTYTGGP